MKLKHGILFACGIGCLGVALAQISGSGGAFLPMSPGARAAGLANAQTASPTGVEAAANNPAALTEVQHAAVAYTYANLADLVSDQQTSAVYRFPGQPWVGGVAWKSVGDAVYSENEVLLSGAYRRGLVALGANYKLRFAGTGGDGVEFIDPVTRLGHQVGATALGWMGFDFGAIITPFGPQTKLGWMVKDVLSRVSWESHNAAGTARGSYSETIPLTMRYGFSFDPDPFLNFNVDFEPSLYHDGISHFATGLQMVPLELMPDGAPKKFLHDVIAVRLGYARNLFVTDPAMQLSLGMGFMLRYQGIRMGIDAATQMNFASVTENPLRLGISLGH